MTKSKSTRRPTCSKCHFHDKVDIAIKGHKQKCRYKNCNCEWCGLLKERQAILSQQTSCIRDARQQKEASDAGLTSGFAFHSSGINTSLNGISSSTFNPNFSNNVPYGAMDAYTSHYSSSSVRQSSLPLQSSMSQMYPLPGGSQGKKLPSSHSLSSYSNDAINNPTSTDFAKISSMCGNNTDSKKNLFHNDLKPYRQPIATQQTSYSGLLYAPFSESAPSSPHSHPSTPPMPPSSVSTEKSSNFSAGHPYNPNPSENVYPMEVPHCDRCRNHGLEFPLKGHKPNCPNRNCQCHKCMLNMERKHIQTEIRQEKHQNDLPGSSGYSMESSISTYNTLSPQPTLPSAQYTPFYQPNSSQSTLLSDFTIPQYLNIRQQDITTCQKSSLIDSKLPGIHYSSYYPQ